VLATTLVAAKWTVADNEVMVGEVVKAISRIPAFPPMEAVQWDSLPTDGSVLVDALFRGQWMPGVYLGLIPNGTLAVRLDSDEWVHECRAHILRLRNDTYDKSVIKPKAAMQ
jgi:hypothetical protein